MTDDEITELLFIREEPVAADLAMVFADASEEGMAQRVRRGARLYHDGYVPKVLVTGGGVLARIAPESKRMAELAREFGVADSDLLVEADSGHTLENVQLSLKLLADRGLLERLTKVILVSSEWHMRRVLLSAEALFPPGVSFVCCPTCEGGCTRETWPQTSVCRREVLQELLLLETLKETGAI